MTGPAATTDLARARPASSAEGAVTLDEILLALAASPCAHNDPERIGRLAFLHWLDSLPDGADFAQEAVAAEELASRTGATGLRVTNTFS